MWVYGLYKVMKKYVDCRFVLLNFHNCMTYLWHNYTFTVWREKVFRG